MDITAINDSHMNGYAQGIVTIGEVYMTDIKAVVVKILSKANGKKIDRLLFYDHGEKGKPHFGCDKVTLDNFEKFVPDLMLLSNAFSKDGWVHLVQCWAGYNENLLRLFAQTFGVPVYGSSSTTNGYRETQGTWTRCTPSGMLYHNAFLPGESDYKFAK